MDQPPTTTATILMNLATIIAELVNIENALGEAPLGTVQPDEASRIRRTAPSRRAVESSTTHARRCIRHLPTVRATASASARGPTARCERPMAGRPLDLECGREAAALPSKAGIASGQRASTVRRQSPNGGDGGRDPAAVGGRSTQYLITY
jgi:hypothetical protein